MAPGYDQNALKADISSLESKREILKRIVDITKAIENMQDSLNAVLVLGVDSKDIPEDALNLYSSLSGTMRNLPVSRIKEYFNNLELIIKGQLDKILRYSGLDFSNDEAIEFISLSSDECQANPFDLLDEFKRTAQTAVSLRVLLRKRGIATPGAPVPVSQSIIKAQLRHLETQETQQRAKAKEKILEMRDDVKVLLENPSYPDSMKQMLKGVVDNLDRDIKLMQKGASLNKLSFIMESEDVLCTQSPDIVLEEIETIEIAGVAGEPAEMSFSKAASRWLNSPWDVSWGDITTDKKSG
jgi:DNA-binding transcriptional MerR regulator